MPGGDGVLGPPSRNSFMQGSSEVLQRAAALSGDAWNCIITVCLPRGCSCNLAMHTHMTSTTCGAACVEGCPGVWAQGSCNHSAVQDVWGSHVSMPQFACHGVAGGAPAVAPPCAHAPDSQHVFGS